MSPVEERRETVVEQPATRVVEEPARVVEQPSTTYVQKRDPVGNAMAASSLIQTVVWAGVVITLLIVGIIILVHWKII